MARRKEKPVEEPFRACDRGGCLSHAGFKAPKTRASRPDYYWFCLDHVREYNQKWDYFSGMNEDDIEAFRRDAVIGHRPTWYMSGNPTHTREHLARAFNRFIFLEDIDYVAPPIPPEVRKALGALGLEHPTTQKTIKSTYKKLAKECHPDLAPDDRQAEERFKTITAAYHHLIESYTEMATVA